MKTKKKREDKLAVNRRANKDGDQHQTNVKATDTKNQAAIANANMYVCNKVNVKQEHNGGQWTMDRSAEMEAMVG